jgi:hypothetical protein
MRDALGGAEKIASIRDFEQSARADKWDNQGRSHGRVCWIRPNYPRHHPSLKYPSLRTPRRQSGGWRWSIAKFQFAHDGTCFHRSKPTEPRNLSGIDSIQANYASSVQPALIPSHFHYGSKCRTQPMPVLKFQSHQHFKIPKTLV